MKRTDYYACPPFLMGVAQIFDFGGTLARHDLPYGEALRNGRTPKFRHSRPESDAEAVREIWGAVGQYLNKAIGEFEKENRLPSVEQEQ